MTPKERIIAAIRHEEPDRVPHFEWVHDLDLIKTMTGGGDYFEIREFVDCIVNDTKPPVDVYEAMDMTVPGLVSEESINRGGTPIPVPDFRTINNFPDDLPRLPSGKIQRRLVRAPYWEGRDKAI